MQGKVSRMTSPMRHKGDGFATGANKGSLWGGEKGKIQQYKPPKKRLRSEPEKRLAKKEKKPIRQVGYWLFSTWNSTGWLLKTAKNMTNHARNATLVLIIYILTTYSPVSTPNKVQELLCSPRTSQTFCYHRTSQTFLHLPPGLVLSSQRHGA